MKSVLDRIQQPGAIRVEFQPIVRVRPDRVELYAVEALARGPRGTSMERPEVLFEFARRKGAESNIDMICITEAFEAYGLLPGQPLLSINVHGATLANIDHFSDRILSAAKAYGIAPGNLMFEVLEYRAPWAIETFLTTLELLRGAGVRIAVDDLGVGASNYQMIVDCHPDYLKVDRHIVNGSSGDRWRRAVLESIATLGRACGAIPIAEGVETAADLEVLLDLGIDTVQGWLYARSTPPEELARGPFFTTAPATQCTKGRCE
jgi:EAL domain-containing protein (putative c-di-GMP-specific phosphodiesterase class I)